MLKKLWLLILLAPCTAAWAEERAKAIHVLVALCDNDFHGVKPVLLTTQLVYPGAMVLEAGIEGWIKGESHEQIRLRAGKAYAKNQKISVKAGIGVFSKP